MIDGSILSFLLIDLRCIDLASLSPSYHLLTTILQLVNRDCRLILRDEVLLEQELLVIISSIFDLEALSWIILHRLHVAYRIICCKLLG